MTAGQVRLHADGFMLGDELLPLLSGSLHYWRLPRERWGPILERVREAGFQVIDTYIPWSVHEAEKARYDFGEEKPQRDLEGFLRLCQDCGLKAVVRPGPHINAELTYFGYPKRLFQRPELFALNRYGVPAVWPTFPRMFPILSYASEAFYEEVAEWFSGLSPILRSHLYPQGPVVMVQLDNEMGYFFRTDPFDLDYSEASRSLYHRFLSERYEDVSRLNESYGTSHESLQTVPLPQGFDGSSRAGVLAGLDWVDYKAYYLLQALTRLKELWTERGIVGLPFSHNAPPNFSEPPLDLRLAEEVVDVQGVDMYYSKDQHGALKEACLWAEGESRLPFAPEFSCGGFLWFRALTHEDERFTTLCAIMYGIRALNLYMLVERDRWYGSPLLSDGAERAATFPFYKRFVACLQRMGWPNLRREASVALVASPLYRKIESLCSGVSPFSWSVLNQMGLGPDKIALESCPMLPGHPERTAFEWRRRAESLLACRGVGYRLTTRVPQLAHEGRGLSDSAVRGIVLPVLDALERPLQEAALLFASRGGTLIMGPRIPGLDDRLAPCDILAQGLGLKPGAIEGSVQERPVGQGRVLLVPDLVGLEQALISFSGALPQGHLLPQAPAGLDVSVLTGPKGRFMFVANATDHDQSIGIEAELNWDVWEDEPLSEGTLTLPPYTVMILRRAWD